VLIVVACALWPKPDIPASLDSIITEELVRSGCKNALPFSFTTEHTIGRRTYHADFEFGPEHPECSTFVTITICRVGKLLDPAEYETTKKQVREKDKKNPPDRQLEPLMFPAIGKRAMVGLVLGPGGGGDWLVFTTSDGRFDIKVEQGNRWSEGVEGPIVLCDRIARDICSKYDSLEGN